MAPVMKDVTDEQGNRQNGVNMVQVNGNQRRVVCMKVTGKETPVSEIDQTEI